MIVKFSTVLIALALCLVLYFGGLTTDRPIYADSADGPHEILTLDKAHTSPIRPESLVTDDGSEFPVDEALVYLDRLSLEQVKDVIAPVSGRIIGCVPSKRSLLLQVLVPSRTSRELDDILQKLASDTRVKMAVRNYTTGKFVPAN